MKVKKPSRLEALAQAVEQDYTHQHTVTIESRRRLWQFEVSEVNRAIVALSAALTNQRRRRAELEAKVSGLGRVIAKRWSKS